jgi:hypothetical protein
MISLPFYRNTSLFLNVPKKECQLALICNKLYIKVDTACCLYTNDKGICDRDEKLDADCPMHYIPDGSGICCYDKNKNDICDYIEEPQHSISDYFIL